VVVFIAETIWAAGRIAHFRQFALKHPDRHSRMLFGVRVSNELAAKAGLFAVSANIKIVDLAWTMLAPWVAEYENWRTDLQLKNSIVTKSFLVKCVVYYYPFFYLAFVREFVEGCEGTECVDELKKNLSVFIIVHIVSVIANILVQIAMTAWAEYSAHQKAQANSSEPGTQAAYTYVQAQAHRPAYAGDTDDYMELTIMLGFISMFSVIYPLCAFMAFVSNLFEIRILAFRMCRVERRPIPRGQDGIGAWLTVMRFVTYLSCVTAVGLIVFRLRPLKTWSEEHQLQTFIIAEHTMLVAVYMITKCIPAKSNTDQCVLEANETAEARMSAGDAKLVQAATTVLVCLKKGSEDITPGKALALN